jgi:hypothetical protein
MKNLKHSEIFELVREVICEWDPYGLIEDGSSKDELDREVAAIIRQLPRIRSSMDSCHVISRVFSSSFMPEPFKPENCREVGDRLFKLLKAKGLLLS